MINLKPNYILTGKYFAHKQVLKFQNYNEFITDEDIMNLFLGLVRLVKKSTEMKIEAKYAREIENLKNKLDARGKY